MSFCDYILNPISFEVKIKLDWRNLWIKKNDYIENYYSKIEGRYPIIDNSINYYITMTEMAIYYLKDYYDYYDYSYIQHKIIINENFFDKKNIQLDVKERDFAEGLKYIFYKDQYNMEEIYNLLEKSKGKFNYDLVIARLIFPSYYYFYFEKLILGDMEADRKLTNIVNNISKYEEYIKKIVDKINDLRIKKIILPF